MTKPDFANLYRAVLELFIELRRMLAEDLYGTIEIDEPDPEWEKAWSLEVEQRTAELDVDSEPVESSHRTGMLPTPS
jgi:hypothetical protein